MIFLQDAPSQSILDVRQNFKSAYVSINAMQLVQFISGSASGIFRHIRALFKTCSGIRVSPAYSEPWHIPITKHIQPPRCIHNTILNIFTKVPSWTFDTVLNAPISYRCYLTSRVTLRYLRDILACLRLIQQYLFLLSHIKNPSIFRKILLQPTQVCFKHYTQYLGRFKVILNPGLFRHVMFQAYSVIFTTLDIFRPFAHIRLRFGCFRHIQNPGTARRIHVYQGTFKTHGLFRHIQHR